MFWLNKEFIKPAKTSTKEWKWLNREVRFLRDILRKEECFLRLNSDK